METTPKKYKYSWPIEATLDVIGGKWKPLVIYQLKDGTLRFNQIVDKVTAPDHPEDADKRSSANWRKTGSLSGKVYPQVPPKVEYSLTETGQSLIPILDELCDWGSEHMGDDIEFKCEE